MTFWAALHKGLQRHGQAVAIAVLEARGSAPRDAGARMLVFPDGAIWGTIGGGALEMAAITRAKAALRDPEPRLETEKKALGPELVQCCGGSVTVLFEVFGARQSDNIAEIAAIDAEAGLIVRDPKTGLRHFSDGDGDGLELARDGTLTEVLSNTRTPVALFGAGHVGRALVLALAPLPFRIDWFDPRPDMFPRHIPANAAPIQLDDVATTVAALPASALVLVMTHSHPLDLEICDAALRRADLGPVGLIGSKTKKTRFFKQLRSFSHSDYALDRLICPIGVPGIAGKEPAVIAASVAAQLLLWRDDALQDLQPAQKVRAIAGGAPV